MRISTSMQYDTQMSFIQKANSRVDEASQKYNTGLKFTTSGEDPSGMALKVKYEADIETYAQYQINAGLAADYLSQSETALDSLWDILNSVEVSLQQAVNGTMDSSSLSAIAEELIQAQAQIMDLMNTKTAEGEYIFSGAQGSQPTITLTSDGNYVCQADGSTRSVQVSPTVTVQVTDSGLNIFQNVALANQLYVYDDSGTLIDDITQITSYDDYMDLYNDIFRTTNSTTDNSITVNFNAATNTFQVVDSSGNVRASGELDSDGQIVFNGITINVNESSLYDATTDTYIDGFYTITFEATEKDNILNVLSDIIAVLQDDSISNEERAEQLALAQISVSNAKENYDKYRGYIGARMSSIDSIINSNSALSLIKETAKANVSEVDTYEAVSDLIKEQMALQAAQQSYTVVFATSLFDYI